MKSLTEASALSTIKNKIAGIIYGLAVDDVMGVATELRDWIDGSTNQKLDIWYNKYGEYFAFKKI